MEELFKLCSLSDCTIVKPIDCLKKYCSLRDEIAAKQAEISRPLYNRQVNENLNGLLEWVNQNDPKMFISPSLKVQRIDENVGYSVIATAPIKVRP